MTYTIQEAAKILRVCPMTVYRKIWKGEISASKVARHYLIPESSLADYIESRSNEEDVLKHLAKKESRVLAATLAQALEQAVTEKAVTV